MVSLECGTAKWRWWRVILWLIVLLPTTVWAQSTQSDWSAERFPTLTDGEEFLHVTDLEMAGRFREFLLKREETLGPVESLALQAARFESLFYLGPDESREMIAHTPVHARSATERHLESLAPAVEFSEEAHCLARHVVHEMANGLPAGSTVAYERAVQRCGLLLHRGVGVHFQLLTREMVDGCETAGILEQGGLLACSIVVGKVPDDRIFKAAVGDEYGTAEVVAGDVAGLLLIRARGTGTIRPVPRVGARPWRRLEILPDSDGRYVDDLVTSVDGPPAPVCRDSGLDPGLEWTCRWPADVETVGLAFGQTVAPRRFDMFYQQLHRSMPPLLPPEVATCEEPVNLGDVSVEMVRAWINTARRDLGLEPLQSVSGMDEWLTMLERNGGIHGDMIDVVDSGLLFDGLLAHSFGESVRLVTEEPCREWRTWIDWHPRLRIALFSPHASHVALSVLPSTVPGRRDSLRVFLYVMEADHAGLQAVMEAWIQSELAERFPRMLRRFRGLRPAMELILDEIERRVEQEGADLDAVIDEMQTALDRIDDMGGATVEVHSWPLESPWWYALPRPALWYDDGLVFRIVRRPQHRVNRVTYHVVFAEFYEW